MFISITRTFTFNLTCRDKRPSLSMKLDWLNDYNTLLVRLYEILSFMYSCENLFCCESGSHLSKIPSYKLLNYENHPESKVSLSFWIDRPFQEDGGCTIASSKGNK